MSSSKSFTGFEDLYKNSLAALLLDVKTQAPTGTALPTQQTAKKGQPYAQSGTTDMGSKAYGNDYTKAQTAVKAYVAKLTSAQLNALANIGFSDLKGDVEKQGDVVNSVMSSYDKAASLYMKNQAYNGLQAEEALQARMHEFDAAIITPGPGIPKPDQ